LPICQAISNMPARVNLFQICRANLPLTPMANHSVLCGVETTSLRGYCEW
jgi:hypothetical protein